MSFIFPEGNVFYRKLTTDLPRIIRGDGIYLYDDQGKRYLDASGGALVVNVGHGVGEVVEAIAKQAGKVAYVNGLQFTNEPVEALAKEIAEVMPRHLNKVYFLTSGTVATETAIKLARQFWVEVGHKGKFKVISHTPGYHGSTLAALSTSGRPYARRMYIPLLHDFALIPAPICYRCPYKETYPACGVKCAHELEVAIQKEGAETVAAYIAEPILGASAGVVAPPLEYFGLIREICDHFDVLFIADEILTGMGRSGTWLAIENYGVEPDVVLLGKGLSGGFAPLSAIVVKEDIVRTIASGTGAFVHGLTYSHTPMICVAGLATIRYIKQHRLVERSVEMGAYLLDRLQCLWDFPFVGDIRGQGLMVGIEFVEDRESRRPFRREIQLAEKIVHTACTMGLVLWSNVGHVDGKDGDLVMLGPPFIITRKQVGELVDLLVAALTSVSKSLYVEVQVKH